MTTTSCLLLSFDGTTWYPETVLKHKSYLLKTIVHPSISFSFALEKQKKKKKQLKQTRKIFSYQLLLVACYTKLRRIYQYQRYTGTATTLRSRGVHKAIKRRAITITMIIPV